VDALSLYLSESPFHSILLCLPLPDPTKPDLYNHVCCTNSDSIFVADPRRMVSLLETEEGENIVQEIKNRRMRLNAPPVDVIEREVWRQVYASPSKDLP